MPLINVTLQLPLRSRFSTSLYGTQTAQISLPKTSLASGTAANQADREYIATRTATTSGDPLDLAGGVLVQRDGTAFSIVKLVCLAIFNRSTTATLTVGGGTSAIANISLTVGPNGTAYLIAPDALAYAVAAGTADVLKVVSSEATSPYDIILIGRSA